MPLSHERNQHNISSRAQHVGCVGSRLGNDLALLVLAVLDTSSYLVHAQLFHIMLQLFPQV